MSLYIRRGILYSKRMELPVIQVVMLESGRKHTRLRLMSIDLLKALS
jgi:hypothetical protein